uniref:Uncharacterized protein n=1 Tax=Arundo donax TaxID=35708 RepID=A0A0A9H453_ARUDO
MYMIFGMAKYQDKRPKSVSFMKELHLLEAACKEKDIY